MEFKFADDSEIISITLDELVDLIKQGRALNHSLLKDRVVTDGAWITIDNLPMFHKYSPVTYQLGKILFSKLALAKRKKELAELCAPVQSAYESGSLIESCFGLESIPSLLADPAVQGAARLCERPSFFPERVWTGIFRQDSIHVEFVTGNALVYRFVPDINVCTDLDRIGKNGYSIEAVIEKYRSAAAITKKSKTLRPDEYENQLCSIEYFSKAVVFCPNVKTMGMYDGTIYRHSFISRIVEANAEWVNPRESDPCSPILEWYFSWAPVLGYPDFGYQHTSKDTIF
jgi:hypothetical protein